MKTINVTFEDAEFALLLAKKKQMSWHDFAIGWEKLKRGTKWKWKHRKL